MAGLQPEYIEYVVQNYSNLVCTIPWAFRFDIRNLLKYGNVIPQDFFQKFPGICQISYMAQEKVLKITESEQRVLIEHIKRSNPWFLSIQRLDLSLKREFYEQISSVQSLTFLQIGPHLENVEFEHFLKLKYLQTFFIQSIQKIPVEFVSKLFIQLKHLKEFKFRATLDGNWTFKIDIYFNESPPDDGRENGNEDDEEDDEELNEEDEEELGPYELRCECPEIGKYPYVFFDYCDNANQLAESIKRMKEDEKLMRFLI